MVVFLLALLWLFMPKEVQVSGLDFRVKDNCDPDPQIFLTITCDEPTTSPHGRGGPESAPDAKIIDDRRVLLRAKRSDDGDGRVYVLSMTATDSSGNAATAAAQVRVNLSQDRKAVDSGQFYDAQQ